ncbi:hypothetical protein LSH36_102g04055 [Paralvinella palmiformis]|uniref:Uncharacterized protein n=1 Tax=Paralvinella palmiformis TaxID=53620 RepID=A0AAD9K0L3_9ANNE|nr:hypothetical protein LSH36_102g04055 [Paralvinella palmiformis]
MDQSSSSAPSHTSLSSEFFRISLNTAQPPDDVSDTETDCEMVSNPSTSTVVYPEWNSRSESDAAPVDVQQDIPLTSAVDQHLTEPNWTSSGGARLEPRGVSGVKDAKPEMTIERDSDGDTAWHCAVINQCFDSAEAVLHQIPHCSLMNTQDNDECNGPASKQARVSLCSRFSNLSLDRTDQSDSVGDGGSSDCETLEG